MPAHLFNPGGHFETYGLYQANEEILSHLGYSWDVPPTTSLSEWEIAKVRDSDQFRDLRSKAEQRSISKDWCDKDPRLSITLPIWDEILLRKIPVIACIRHPYEAADSLRLREGIPLELGIIIWRYYNQNLANNCIGRQALAIDYDRDFMNSPVQTAEAIYKFAREMGYSVDSSQISDASSAQRDSFRRNKSGTAHFSEHSNRYSRRVMHAVQSYEELRNSPIEKWSLILEPSTQLRIEDEQWMMLYRQYRLGNRKEENTEVERCQSEDPDPRSNSSEDGDGRQALAKRVSSRFWSMRRKLVGFWK